MRRVTLITLFLSLGLLGLVPSLAQDATSEATTEPPQLDNQAYVRVAHFSPETAGVDIFLDDQATDFKGVEYKTLTKWIAVPSGPHAIKLVPPSGATDTADMNPMDVDLQAGTWTTYVVTGSAENNTLAVEPVQENFEEMRPGVSSFTFVNAIEG